jgi:hypothetical protein
MASNSVDTRPVSVGALTIIVNVDDLSTLLFGKDVTPSPTNINLTYFVDGSDLAPGVGDFAFAPGSPSGMPYDLANILTLPSIVNSISAQSSALSASNSATLLVSAGQWTKIAPTIISQPADFRTILGDTANIAVITDSVSGNTFQWYKKPSGGSWSAISGANNYYFSPTAASSGAISGDDGSQYYCIVANTSGSVTSITATMSITGANIPLNIITNPVNVTTYVGQQANFFVQVEGTPYPNLFWWQRSNDDGVTWTTIGGANSFNYNFTTVLGDNYSKYRCIVGIVSPYTVNLSDWIGEPNLIMYPK